MQLLSRRFQQCLGSFTMLLPDIYLKKFFAVRNFGIYKLWWSSFFWNVQNLIQISKMLKKNMRNLFSFLDINIWICCIKLSLLRREYMSWVVNVPTNNPKILYITKRDISKVKLPTVINKDDKGFVMETSTVFRTVSNVTCWKVLGNGHFQTFIWARFLQSIISETYELWGSSFFQNVQNLI